MVCKRIIFSILFTGICLLQVMGQPRYKIEYYSTKQGLSHQRITTMIKDQEGFMWFGTWDGINRFNGRSFNSYKSAPGDSSQLKSDRIDQIVEDEKGDLWIMAYDNQIYRFDKKREQYIPLPEIKSPVTGKKILFYKILAVINDLVWLQTVNDGIITVPQNKPQKDQFVFYRKDGPAGFQLKSNSVHFLYKDGEQQIWIGTANGISCLVKSNGTYKNIDLAEDGLIANSAITTMAEDADCVYFASTKGQLLTYFKQTKSIRARTISDVAINDLHRATKLEYLYASTQKGELLAIDLHDQSMKALTYRTGEPLFNIFEDRLGYLWIEPDKLGIIRFNPTNRAFQQFYQKGTDNLKLVGNRFRVLEDNNGLLWFNMKGGGFGYFNNESQTVEFSLNTPDDANRPLPQNVYHVFFDKAGLLWVTTYNKELVKIVIQGNEFNQQMVKAEGALLADNEVRGIMYDKKNRLWLGCKNGQVHVYQNDNKIKGLFENEPIDWGQVYTILQDRKGNIWLGTKGNGIYKAAPINQEETKYRLTHFLPDETGQNGLKCREIYALLEDKQGRIWVGSFDKGLSVIMDDGLKPQFLNSGPLFENYPTGAFHRIRNLSLDGSGNIWIGTVDGLLVMNPNIKQDDSGKYAAYRKIPGNKESLGNNDIQFVFCDQNKRMWLATSGGGFSEAIGNEPFKKLRFRNYTTKDGMPNDYVLSCASDRTGNIWIATENGLSKFSPGQQRFRNYDLFDGLPNASFSEASVSQQYAKDQLVFGTTNGYLSFNPEKVNSQKIAANIAFTNLHINNEEAGPSLQSFAIASNINYIDGLRLKYNQNIISIDYTILDHRAGANRSFAYRLLGFDSTWHNDRQQQRATYTNLPPGNYVLEVKILSSDLYSNVPFKRLSINILPPPWKTWWACLLYFLAVILLLALLKKYAQAMIRLRNKVVVEKKLSDLKQQFFTNISHELRTPLTLIISPLAQLARKEKLSVEGNSLLDVARKNADRMVRFINQLLDLRKVQSEKATLRISRVELHSFVIKIAAHFTEAVANKNLAVEWDMDSEDLVGWIDAEKMDVVLYNLLGNAVKFSPEGKKITIKIWENSKEDNLTISVADEGPGVKPEQLKDIFELFYEGGNDAMRVSKGTGIGLALSKELVELHGGSIYAENNKSGGLTVTIQLKAGSNHFYDEQVSFMDGPQNLDAPLSHSQKETVMPTALNPATLPNNPQLQTVLLVEDNDELRNFLASQLSEFYKVETANDGEEGLQKAESLLPDLIISDIMMPKMDGIEMLDRVKNNLQTSHIPVVLLSAKYSIESQLEGLKYGADCYITKPFNNEFLMASVNNLLVQRRKLFDLLVQKKMPETTIAEPVLITNRDQDFLKEVIQVIEEKMKEPEFNIDSVAASMAMGRTAFYKKFKSLTSIAPVEFVRDLRLEKARQYLEKDDYNVSEVAYLVGFSNPKYFSTCFKEKFEVSPTEFQKRKV